MPLVLRRYALCFVSCDMYHRDASNTCAPALSVTLVSQWVRLCDALAVEILPFFAYFFLIAALLLSKHSNPWDVLKQGWTAAHEHMRQVCPQNDRHSRLLLGHSKTSLHLVQVKNRSSEASCGIFSRAGRALLRATNNSTCSSSGSSTLQNMAN